MLVLLGFWHQCFDKCQEPGNSYAQQKLTAHSLETAKTKVQVLADFGPGESLHPIDGDFSWLHSVMEEESRSLGCVL